MKLSEIEFSTITVVFRGGFQITHRHCRYTMEAGPSGFLLTVLTQEEILVANFDDVERIHLVPATVQSVGTIHRMPTSA